MVIKSWFFLPMISHFELLMRASFCYYVLVVTTSTVDCLEKLLPLKKWSESQLVARVVMSSMLSCAPVAQ